MSFQSRIDALYTAGTLVIGYIPDGTDAMLEQIRRYDSEGLKTHFVYDTGITPLEGVPVRAGWITGSDPVIPWGAEGGLGSFGFKEMKGQYGSPGVSHRFGRNHTMCLQWAERYSAALIGLSSQTDTGFRGGVKTNMIDLERGKVTNSIPVPTLQNYTTNTAMEIVVTSGSDVLPEANRDPSKAQMGLYGSHTHNPFPKTTGVTITTPYDTLRYRPEKWVVWTLLCEFGSTWSMRPGTWQQSHTPGLLHQGTNISSYILDDYRITDARWRKSAAQEAAYNSGDAVAFMAADPDPLRQHRFRLWGQYEDQAEPFMTHDATGMLLGPGNWGPDEATLGDEAHYGQCNWATLAYRAGEVKHDLTNWYRDPETGVRDLYSPYLQGKRAGIDLFPDRFGPAATHRISKWFGPIIVAREAINPKFFGGAGETPPDLPASVMIPSGVAVEGT